VPLELTAMAHECPRTDESRIKTFSVLLLGVCLPAYFDSQVVKRAAVRLAAAASFPVSTEQKRSLKRVCKTHCMTLCQGLCVAASAAADEMSGGVAKPQQTRQHTSARCLHLQPKPRLKVTCPARCTGPITEQTRLAEAQPHAAAQLAAQLPDPVNCRRRGRHLQVLAHLMYCTQLPALLWHGHVGPVARLALNTGKQVTLASKDHKGALAGTLAAMWTWIYLPAHRPTAAIEASVFGALHCQCAASLAGTPHPAARGHVGKGFVVVDECCSGGCDAGSQT
jgi:hypothetical protein